MTLPNTNPTIFIELQNVIKTFKNAAGTVTVLKGIDAGFYSGQFTSIVGRSGSGKSTLLNMITGIDHPTAGVVRIDDKYLHTMNEGKMSVWRGRQMGIVFQFFQLLPMLTVLENIMLPMDFCDMYTPAERELRAQMLLKMVGLQGLENKYPAAISGGQQQSAAVARALANDPPILVADEPTGNLDTRTAERVIEIFEEQVQCGKTVLMVTHDITLASRAGRKLVISDGMLVNEFVSQAFPSLHHNVLLTLSKEGRAVHFPPGQPLFSNGRLPALMIITAGNLDVHTSTLFGRSKLAARLGPGDALNPANTHIFGRSLHSLHPTAPLDALVFDSLPPSEELKHALERTIRR